MSKSTKSRRASKPPKPEKPYVGFPLFPHASGRWAKKIRQRTHFFGRWGHKQGAQIVPVEDVNASAAEAKKEFDRQWPYLSEGRSVPPVDTRTGCTIRDLCNAFLTAKQNRLEGGELSAHSFSEYQRTTDRIMAHFGRDRLVDDLRPDDFENFRKVLAKDCGIVTLKSKINRARVVFKFASDSRLIDRPVEYGRAFDRPSAKLLRQARNEAGPRLFEADELQRILTTLDGKPVKVKDEPKPVTLPAAPEMKAMVLLGLNCGFGNTDVANLPLSALDLENGWVNYPRPKTAIQRRVPLWPETVEALKVAIAQRPAPVDPADADLCFLTNRGTRFVRIQESKTSEGRNVTINSLSRRFEALLHALKINGRRGLNFYALRHTFETQAGESKDQVAVDAIMGHVDPSMAANYRQRISDERLKAVVEVVRSWLFAE